MLHIYFALVLENVENYCLQASNMLKTVIYCCKACPSLFHDLFFDTCFYFIFDKDYFPVLMLSNLGLLIKWDHVCFMAFFLQFRLFHI